MDCQGRYSTTHDPGGNSSWDRDLSSAAGSPPASSGSTAGFWSQTSHGNAHGTNSASGLSVAVTAWGYRRAGIGEFEGLRRRLPNWAPPDLPDHFFRYSDEQTMLATWAIDGALRRASLSARQTADWGIIAAPEFLGRQHLAVYLERFARNGGPRVSPNSIVQHSLHSVSGSLSILLGSRGPNVGTGGGHDALAEGLLAALTLFDLSTTNGCWLVASTWDPLPLPDTHGQCSDDPVCHAVALGLQPLNAGTSSRLVLHRSAQGLAPRCSPLNVMRLATSLEQFDLRGLRQTVSWRLPWGGTLSLELNHSTGALRRAA